MKYLVIIALTVSLNARASSSDALEESGDGAVSFSATNFMNDCTMPFPDSGPTVPGAAPGKSGAPVAVCDNSNPNFSGRLTYDGTAAQATYKTMVGVKIHPEAKDIEKKDINTLSWEDLEYKSGKDIFCYKKLSKDVQGKLLRSTICSIELNKLKVGAVK